jgi:hypothetical protein
MAYHKKNENERHKPHTHVPCSIINNIVLLLSGNFGGLLGRSLSHLLFTFAWDDIFLARAVDGDFNGDFTSFDLLSVHLLDGLLLEIFGAESNKSKSTALARFVTGLELLNHEARNGTKSDLGGLGLVVLEQFLKLQGWVLASTRLLG